jgi:mannose/fructose/N-acetylgalactosamine-specific phosphotransferase system component IIC
MEHFKDVSWAKKIDGGRNYFQSCDVITATIKAIASIVVTRFIIKDKIAAKTGLVVCSAFAIGITIADLFFYFGNGGYHELHAPYLPEFFYAWGCWEYFTGFIAGAIITAFIVLLKPEADVPETVFKKLPQKLSMSLTFLAGMIFLIGFNIVRPVMVRYEDSKAMILAIAIAVLFALGVVALLVKNFGFNAEKKDFKKFALILLFFFVAFINIVYLVIGTPDCIHLFGNFGFQHSMAIMSAGIILIWLAFAKTKSVRLK